MSESVYVITFQSTHAAMAASKQLNDMKVTHYTIPTPREIRAGCGMALRFPIAPEVLPQIWEALKDSGLTDADMALHLMIGDAEYLPLEL